MTEEINGNIIQDTQPQETNSLRARARQYAPVLCWIPIVVLCLLGVVLFLFPIANVVVASDARLTGYGVFQGDWLSGLKTPVIVTLILACVCLPAGVTAAVLKKYRTSLGWEILAVTVSFGLLATGVGQAIWLNSMSFAPGTFSILCIVFGSVTLLLSGIEMAIHMALVADNATRALWKSEFNHYKGWLYLLPVLVLLGIFTVWPIFNTIRMAFLNGYKSLDEVGGQTFTFGIENFRSVMRYRGFLTCLGNTMLLTVITVPLSTMLALLVAVALNSIKPLRRLFQTIFFLPYVTNAIAIGMVFMAMFQMVGADVGEPTSIGIINRVIVAFGGKRINWVNAGSGYWSNMFVLIIYIVWNALPFKILVLLGGLQGVNKQYYDAAKVDGASRLRTFWRITVPLLSPMIAYVVITGFIGGFKEYSSIVGIFGDTMGPIGDAGRLNTMVGFIYDCISGNDQGRASAAALILFAIIFVVTMINMYVSKKKVHY